MGHWAVGYLLGKSGKFNKKEMIAFIIGNVIPDIDLIFTFFIGSLYGATDWGGYNNFADIIHRSYCHSLLVWGIVLIVAYLFIKKYALLVYMGIIMHLFLDSLDTVGVPPFYPLIKQYVHFDFYPYNTIDYVKSPQFGIEIGITVFAIFMIIFLITRRSRR